MQTATATAAGQAAVGSIGWRIVRPDAMMGAVRTAAAARPVGRSALGARVVGSADRDATRSGRRLPADDAGRRSASGRDQPDEAESQSQEKFCIHRLNLPEGWFPTPGGPHRATAAPVFFIDQRIRKMWTIIPKDIFGRTPKLPRSCRIGAVAINYRDDFRTPTGAGDVT